MRCFKVFISCVAHWPPGQYLEEQKKAAERAAGSREANVRGAACQGQGALLVKAAEGAHDSTVRHTSVLSLALKIKCDEGILAHDARIWA